MVFISSIPLAISDISANIITTYDYDAYGNVSLTSGSQAFQNDRLFTGREYEKETGLYYYRARFYSQKTGRFLSRDPIGIQDDVNLYAYVGNNPVMFTDPSGKEKKFIASKINEFGNTLINISNTGNWNTSYKEQLIRDGNALKKVAQNYYTSNFSINSLITDHALQTWYNDSSDFSKNGVVEGNFYRDINSGEYKCSTYVGKVLEDAFGYVDNSDFSIMNFGYNYPTANSWAYGENSQFQTISSSQAIMGDIVAFGAEDGDLGHVGIYLGEGLYISAREGSWYGGTKFNELNIFQSSDGVMIKDIGELGNVTFKRYKYE